MKRKVLVIDDEKPTLTMFGLFLRAYGYEVFVAENGAIGLDLLQREEPEIVFTDIKMPGMDGFELLRRIKRRDPKTEVVVITGHGDMDLAVEALNLDATDVIDKPIQRSALEAALGRAEERLQQSADRKDRIHLRWNADIAVVEIFGTLTAAAERPLQEACREAVQKEIGGVLLHFDETASINGAGIALLIRLIGELRSQQHQVAVSGLTENFRHIFHMVGIARLAEVHASEAQGVEALQRRS